MEPFAWCLIAFWRVTRLESEIKRNPVLSVSPNPWTHSDTIVVCYNHVVTIYGLNHDKYFYWTLVMIQRKVKQHLLNWHDYMQHAWQSIIWIIATKIHMLQIWGIRNPELCIWINLGLIHIWIDSYFSLNHKGFHLFAESESSLKFSILATHVRYRLLLRKISKGNYEVVWVNILRPRQNCWHFQDDIFICISWMEMYEFCLSFHCSWFLISN